MGKLVSSVQKDLVASLLTFIACLVETKSDGRAECCSARVADHRDRLHFNG
ncbi:MULTISPECIES: hypothetical protein [unclassified Mesorhizobium]|uniref:hypothetical protein n=1 Tax=unclassified Mesorhizobium TaxID=325217 RepID=UPI0013E3753B|nr:MULTISPECIES: hypothetical protein [unclassified Mesorhizobium]